MRLIFSVAVVLSVLVGCLQGRCGQISPSSKPDDNSVTEATLSSLRSLQSKNCLELSTATTSFADQFYFALNVDYGAKVGAAAGQPLQFIVVRDKGRVAMLVHTPDGKCWTYCTNGLFLTIDRDHPGSVKRVKLGSPRFLTQIGDDGMFNVNFGFDQDAVAPEIKVDFSGIIIKLISAAKTAFYNEQTKCFTIHDSESDWCFEIPSSNDLFAIKSATLKNNNGLILRYSFSGSGNIPKNYIQLLDEPATIDKDLAKAKIQVEDAASIDGTAFRIPVDAGKDPGERAILLKLNTMLLPTEKNAEATTLP